MPLTFPPPPFSSFIVFDTRLLPSGPDHGLALWSNGSSQGARTLYAQRFRLDDGALDPGWPAGGVVVIPPDPLTGLAVFTDGSGGAYVLREANGVPLATHLRSDGSVVTNVVFTDAAARYKPQYHVGAV